MNRKMQKNKKKCIGVDAGFVVRQSTAKDQICLMAVSAIRKLGIRMLGGKRVLSEPLPRVFE